MADSRSIRALTARLWLATHGEQPLQLPPGRYATDGWKLWKLDGEEEAECKEAAQATSQEAHPADGNSGARAEHTISSHLHGGGDGCDEGRSECRDGVRQLRGASGRWSAGREHSEHSVQVPKLRGVQRDARLEQQLVEGVQDFEDGRANQRQRISDWRSVAKGWEAGDVALHLHLTLGAEDGEQRDAQEWCADIERTATFDQLVHLLHRPVRDHAQVGLAKANHCGYEYSMLIRVGEVSEPPDRLRSVPAAVRLIPADDCPIA